MILTAALIVSFGINYHLFKRNKELFNITNELKKKLDTLKRDYDFLIERFIEIEKERSHEVRAAKEMVDTVKLYKAYQAFYKNKEIGET